MRANAANTIVERACVRVSVLRIDSDSRLAALLSRSHALSCLWS